MTDIGYLEKFKGVFYLSFIIYGFMGKSHRVKLKITKTLATFVIFPHNSDYHLSKKSEDKDVRNKY